MPQSVVLKHFTLNLELCFVGYLNQGLCLPSSLSESTLESEQQYCQKVFQSVTNVYSIFVPMFTVLNIESSIKKILSLVFEFHPNELSLILIKHRNHLRFPNMGPLLFVGLMCK
jgi:hypothetical protein